MARPTLVRWVRSSSVKRFMPFPSNVPSSESVRTFSLVTSSSYSSSWLIKYSFGTQGLYKWPKSICSLCLTCWRTLSFPVAWSASNTSALDSKFLFLLYLEKSSRESWCDDLLEQVLAMDFCDSLESCVNDVVDSFLFLFCFSLWSRKEQDEKKEGKETTRNAYIAIIFVWHSTYKDTSIQARFQPRTRSVGTNGWLKRKEHIAW